jgi:methionyl-tRNA formyltransferase
MRIVFMGSPDFACPALSGLIQSDHDILAVYSQPPKKAGRGHKVTPTPVHQLAEKNNIPVHTPAKLDGDEVTALKNYAPGVIVVAAYGLLLPKNVLDIAPCLNIHPSALPRWRGAAPLNRTILAGDTTTDVCIMQMEEGLDTGPVYLRERYTVGEDETAGELHDRLAKEGACLLLRALEDWQTLTPIPQSESGIKPTYAHKFKPKKLEKIRPLDFHKTAEELHNRIRGLSPWPGATAVYETAEKEEIPLKILASHIHKKEGNNTPGSIMKADKQGILIGCQQGVIQITYLQKPGNKALPAMDFLNGFPHFIDGKLK